MQSIWFARGRVRVGVGDAEPAQCNPFGLQGVSTGRGGRRGTGAMQPILARRFKPGKNSATRAKSGCPTCTFAPLHTLSRVLRAIRVEVIPMSDQRLREHLQSQLDDLQAKGLY